MSRRRPRPTRGATGLFTAALSSFVTWGALTSFTALPAGPVAWLSGLVFGLCCLPAADRVRRVLAPKPAYRRPRTRRTR